MFQKLYPIFLTSFCLLLLLQGGEANAQGNELQPAKVITQRWMVGVESVENTDSLSSLLSRTAIGGILINGTNSLEAIGHLVEQLQASKETKLLIGLNLTDVNQAAQQRLGLFAPFSVLASTGDTVLVNEAAKADALHMRSAGIDFVFTDPLKFSFGTGFGASPQFVKEVGARYFTQLSKAGIDVIATVSDHLNDDNGIPMNEMLEHFKSLSVKGIDLTAVKDNSSLLENEYDASRYLKKELGFQPLFFSRLPDGKLKTKDLKSPISDFLLLSLKDAYSEFFEFETAKIKYSRQKAVVEKISQWKLQRLLVQNQPIDRNLRLQHESLAFELGLKSSVLLANADGLIPFIDLGNRSFAAAYFGGPAIDFFDYLHKYTTVREFDIADVDGLTAHARQLAHFDNFIVALDLSWFDALPIEDQASLLTQLIALQNEKTEIALVLLGVSTQLQRFSAIRHISYHPVNMALSQHLVPQLLFGAYGYSGRWTGPVDLYTSATTKPIDRLKYAEPWMRNIKGLEEIDSIAIRSITQMATPGCQILVAQKGMVLYEKSFGYLSYDSLMPVTNSTLYDLASLTKVSATLQALMLLVDQGKINIDKQLGEYLPATHGTNKEHLTVKNVLLHQAGLKPYIPFWQQTYQNRRKKILDPMFFNASFGEEFSMEILPGMYSTPAMKDSVWRWTLDTDLMTLAPGDSGYTYKYSDLGFMILQQLVEEVAHTSLDEFVGREVYKPLGMERLCFQPLCSYPYNSIAPTELDYAFRKDMVWGTVHDENAAIMGGVAGHAGLFGNANSLAVLLQMNLQRGQYGGKQIFDSKVVDLFTKRLSPESPRALGWDMKDLTFTRNNTSFWSSETTYGHTGFTGTAVWIDPEMELIYIFLSNRVHPDADNYKLVESNIRTRIQDVIYQSLGWQFSSGE